MQIRTKFLGHYLSQIPRETCTEVKTDLPVGTINYLQRNKMPWHMIGQHWSEKRYSSVNTTDPSDAS